MATRGGDMYAQVYNNLESNGKITFYSRSYDSTEGEYAKNFWLPDHVQKITNDYLKTIAKRDWVIMD